MNRAQRKPEGLSMTRQATLIDKEIGQSIKVLRRKAGMSQNRMAHLIGVTFQQVQKYESGKNRIAVAMLIEIARALECSIHEILGEEGALIPSRDEYGLLVRWRNLPSDRHRDLLHTLMGWL
jgi:transcriptional regulator with XRE-family HTH domain